MPTFLLVRHGETEWNAKGIQQGWLDSDLTENGVQQAMQVATQLPPDTTLIFASDLGRAQHSAEIIAQSLPDVKILTDWRLRERGFGDMVGQPIDRTEIDTSFADEHASYRGAEPVVHMNERLKSFIRDCALFDYDRFVMVAHSGVLNRFGYLLDDGYTHIEHPNSSILEFEIDFADRRLQAAEVAPWRPV